MRLTITQQRLLQTAAEHPTVSVTFGWISSRRDSGYGYRRADAARALVKIGLLTFVSSDRGIHHFAHGWGADHYSTCTYRITDAGRACTKGEKHDHLP